jgi:hypothetical protein
MLPACAIHLTSGGQFVAKLCDMGATAAQAEDVIRICRKKIDREMGPIEQKVRNLYACACHPAAAALSTNNSVRHWLNCMK